MNFDILHDYVDQIDYLGYFMGPRNRSILDDIRNIMNFYILHDHVVQNGHIGSCVGHRTRSKLILLISNTFKEILGFYLIHTF